MTALLDSSAMVAALDPRDPWHAAVRTSLAGERFVPRLPITVLPEVAWLVDSRRGSRVAAAVIRAIAAGTWPIEPVDNDDVRRAGELLERYADSRLSFVDATVVALAERLGVSRIYTLDRHDFGLVRPKHVAAFELLPVLP
ncbi:MAG: PIN domain-containing protein [Chloroflexi bacterium]|nr:PIN domain-containing protein [Chloroflexota bacterium]